LLGAAQEVFVAQGYHAAAMDDIADRAGVSKPVLYQHFPGKLELYLALLDESAEKLTAIVRDALSSTTENRERVPATFRAFFDFVGDEGEAFRLVFESDLSNEPAVRARLDAIVGAGAGGTLGYGVGDHLGRPGPPPPKAAPPAKPKAAPTVEEPPFRMTNLPDPELPVPGKTTESLGDNLDKYYSNVPGGTEQVIRDAEAAQKPYHPSIPTPTWSSKDVDTPVTVETVAPESGRQSGQAYAERSGPTVRAIAPGDPTDAGRFQQRKGRLFGLPRRLRPGPLLRAERAAADRHAHERVARVSPERGCDAEAA
jgi:hypothetical protein